MNIFVHYLDKEVLDSIGLPRNTSSIEENLILSIKVALLLCEDAVYIPFSNYCESELAKKIIDYFQELIPLAAIRLVSSSETLDSFLQKKLQSYDLYQTSQIQEQINQAIETGIPGVWEHRNNSATTDIINLWENSIDDNFWSELYQLTNYRKISRFERELSFVPRRLNGRAFVADNVLSTLKLKTGSNLNAKKLINTQVTRAYIKSYLDEFNCTCLKDFFIHGISVDYMLPCVNHAHISYSSICRTLSSHKYKGINMLEWLRRCSVYEIFELKNSDIWQELAITSSIMHLENIEPIYHPEKKGENNMQSFIVHGHDELEKYRLKDYIQNTLKWTEPYILADMPSHGKTIIEKFEALSNQTSIVFVLLTPDDKYGDEIRARQNVIFELGYFLGKFGRNSGRILLLYKGKLDLPSDISGVVYINIDNGIESAGEHIRKELTGLL